MATPHPLTKPSFEEFLELEACAEVRHEYVAGEIYAMAGGSKVHNLIVGNAYIALRIKYDPAGCKVYSENVLLKMALGDDRLGYYPDVMLVCDPADAPGELYAEKPCVLIEVLSDSTQHIDRGDKLRDYKTLDSLQTYLLVSQQAAHVTVYQRAQDWKPQVLTRAEDSITLNCGAEAPATLTLAEIYRGLDFGV